MCFSANASFGSGVVLGLIGISTLRKTSGSSQRAIALIPLIFAVQQIAEGFVWLSMINGGFSSWRAVFPYIFLTFSHIIWPVWMPLSVLILENGRKRKNILRVLFFGGLLLAAYHVFSLSFFRVSARVDQHHIQYFIDQPAWMRLPSNVLYGSAAILPAFVSSVRRMWWLGLFLLLSYLFTYFFFHHYIVSVWCYYATFISIVIYLVLSGLRNEAGYGGIKGNLFTE